MQTRSCSALLSAAALCLAAEEKMARARQDRPAWTAKSSFKMEGGGKTFLLGVGLQRAMPDALGTTLIAEGKARAGLLGLKGGATQTSSASGKTTSTTSGKTSADAADWWLGPDGTFYALVVEEQAAEPAGPPAPAPAAPK